MSLLYATRQTYNKTRMQNTSQANGKALTLYIEIKTIQWTMDNKKWRGTLNLKAHKALAKTS